MGIMATMNQSQYNEDMRVTAEVIDAVVAVIVSEASPSRIVLFGSAARGPVEEANDIDIMLVVDESVDRRATARKLYRDLLAAGIGVPVNLIVATESVIEQHRNRIGLVYRDIARDGCELYVAA